MCPGVQIAVLDRSSHSPSSWMTTTKALMSSKLTGYHSRRGVVGPFLYSSVFCINRKGFGAPPGPPNSLHPGSMPLVQPKHQVVSPVLWWISCHNLPIRHLFNIACSLLYAGYYHLRYERRCKDEYFCQQRINFQLELAANLVQSPLHQGPPELRLHC